MIKQKGMKSVNKLVTLLALFLAALPLFSQVRTLDFSERLESARKLYYNGSYFAAEKAFNELSIELGKTASADRSEIEAFKVLCAIATDKVNMAGLVANFCQNYPNAPQQDKINLELASRYFDNGDYSQALKVFESIDRSHVARNDRTEYDFKKAYCQMRAGDNKSAIASFERIRKGIYTKYTIPSTYYLAYSCYMERKFSDAAPLFEECFADQRFELLSKYYAVESHFMMEDNGYVISYGPDLMDKLDRDLQINLAKILSETFYKEGQPETAAKYLDMYRSSGTEMSRKDFYFSGILSYSLKSYHEALSNFDNVIGPDDELTQNAYYYAANSYLQSRNKIAALDYFKKASESGFDPVIKEDAMFNFAKLSFDVNSDISQFALYMDEYPDNGKDDVINGYMAASFIRAKDYRSAVEVLSKIKNHTGETAANLQKAAFFRAIQLIEHGGYRSAIPVLELSLEYRNSNQDVENLAKYWLAECYYRNELYASAIELNSELMASRRFRASEEYKTALFNQGYCYFKTADYVAAEQCFSSYLNGSFRRKNYEKDAKMRLADTYFMQRKYQDAIDLYEEISGGSDIYPDLQAALSYGLLGNDSQKIATLKRVIKNNVTSQLYPQALFELGRTYVQTGKDDDATQCFFTLIGIKGDSTYYAKSLLELAMICSNNAKYERAIEYYKKIITETPMASEVQDALSGMESIYQAQNRPEEFLAYIDQLGMSTLKTADEKQYMLFNAAEQLFLTGKYNSAISSLKRFLKSYPSGVKAPQATFYLAECQRNQGNMENAADNYAKVMKMDESSLFEPASLNLATISLEMQNYRKAISAFDALASIAESQEMKTAAYMGRMRAYFGDKQYEKAITDGQRVIAVSGITEQMRREVNFIMAKSYKMSGARDLARTLFEEISKNGNDAFGAESAYILIQDAYDNGDFQGVERLVYEFADKGSSQMYWLAKSFIVLGDSFADRDDYTQARATFESIRDSYSPGEKDDVLYQVNSRLEMLNNIKK